MSNITKEMTIREVITTNENLADVLMEYGMHCLGCPMHTLETLQQACDGHGLDSDEVVGALNKYLDENAE